jgi:predicted GH43/DUF377 family glycosyl hydrolase
MSRTFSRRNFSRSFGLAIAGLPFTRNTRALDTSFTDAQIAPFRTPYKYGKLVLGASIDPNAFDSKSIDDPFVFLHNSLFHMLYIGFDGSGYQTGLARSRDLVNWERVACVARRDPSSKYTRYNIALSCIVREHDLTAPGKLKKMHGRYLGAWNAYPNAGYEEGAAVIGLAWSDDLLHW